MIRARLVAVAVLLLFAPALHAGWMRRYEGPAGVQRAVLASLPGGATVVAANGESNVLFVADSSGAVVASRKFTGQQIFFVTATPAGDVYAGYAAGESLKMEVAKLRRDLSVVWTRRFTVEGRPVRFHRGAGTADGGVVLAGTARAASTFLKLDARGNVEWTLAVDPSDSDFIAAIRQTRDGGYVAVGSTSRFRWIVRIDAAGKLRWQRAYGASSDTFESVAELEDGSFVAVDQTGPILVKMDRTGSIVWSRRAGPAGYGFSLAATPGGVVAAMQPGATFHLAGIGTDGSLRWQRAYAPDGHTVRANMTEDGMLAVSGRQIAFTAATGNPLSVFSFDADAGPGECRWFTKGTLTLTPVDLREEATPVEVSMPAVAFENGEAVFEPASIAAIPEACSLPESPWVIPAVSSNAKTLPFRAEEVTPAQRREWSALFVARKFSELDRIAAKLRTERSRDPMRPNHVLRAFYRALRDNEAAPVDTRLQLLRAWVKAAPQSVTARIALADGLAAAAWEARGTGYADTVTASAAATHDRLMTEAKQALDAVPAGDADAKYWTLKIAFAHELGLEDVREVALRALSLHQDPELAYDAANYLFPQWGGSPELYMKWADQAARATSRTLGDAVYLWLVSRIRDTTSSEDYKRYPVDWERVKKGAEELMRLRPDWLPAFHEYAKLADKYDDHETVRKLFARPELEWYEDAYLVWGSRQLYDLVRSSFLPPPPAKTASAPSPGPPPIPPMGPVAPLSIDPVLLRSELQLGDAVHRGINAFLVQTERGVFAISALPQVRFAAAPLLRSWKVWEDRWPRDGAAASSLIARTDAPDYWRSAALQLDGARPKGAVPMIVRSAPAAFLQTVYVVACRPDANGACRQEALPARVLSANRTSPPSDRFIYYGIEVPDGPDGLSGAPVVDENRDVLAVVTTTECQAGRVFLIAEAVADLVRE